MDLVAVETIVEEAIVRYFAARRARVTEFVERHFSVRIGIDALSREALDRRVTLYYSSEARLAGILDDVATALGLRYREVSGGWEVVPAP